MKILSMIIALFFLPLAMADEKLNISYFDAQNFNSKYSRKIAGLPSHLVIKGGFSWSYIDKKSLVVLVNQIDPAGPRTCLAFDVSNSARLIFGSDPHQSCRIIGEPQVRNKNGDYWVFIPIEIDASGENENYIPGSVNLLLDKLKRSLCSPEGADPRSMCRKQVYERFYALDR